MNRQTLGGLVLINAVLLGALWLVMGGGAERAEAQLGGHGDYLMISGQMTGRSDISAIYLLDLRTQTLAAISFDTRTQKLEPLGTRSIDDDVRSGGRR